ncbi:hypothetical protein CCUS01_03775 [Colletotrichum cuscutae]|uniref:Uncharacterized protein n=1 Tax=Colletotrichum cuscutae TaxID=1209917 RepID=A0AAI9VGL4_9PEZI|nr:hypothetical protein CCUS01_03775 [Colletotrichum cuscutae]
MSAKKATIYPHVDLSPYHFRTSCVAIAGPSPMKHAAKLILPLAISRRTLDGRNFVSSAYRSGWHVTMSVQRDNWQVSTRPDAVEHIIISGLLPRNGLCEGKLRSSHSAMRNDETQCQRTSR